MLDKVADRPQAAAANDVTHVDVLIAGAGISGIGSKDDANSCEEDVII